MSQLFSLRAEADALRDEEGDGEEIAGVPSPKVFLPCFALRRWEQRSRTGS
jgi:hypothetical protein